MENVLGSAGNEDIKLYRQTGSNTVNGGNGGDEIID